MSNVATKILEIEQEMARTQRNKATEGHLGLLKAKIAKLRKGASRSSYENRRWTR